MRYTTYITARAKTKDVEGERMNDALLTHKPTRRAAGLNSSIGTGKSDPQRRLRELWSAEIEEERERPVERAVGSKTVHGVAKGRRS